MNIGFIGAGNMATAFIGGLLNAGTVKEENLFLTDASSEALKKLSGTFPSVSVSTDNLAFLDRVDFLVLSVKPHIYEPVIKQIRDQVRSETVVITIAAGKNPGAGQGPVRTGSETGQDYAQHSRSCGRGNDRCMSQ